MYPPGSELAGKKAIEGAWAFIRNWFISKRQLEQRIRELGNELAEERSGRVAFEQSLSGLECRAEDDGMYWKKDGSRGPFCPLCLDADRKLIQLVHGNREGSFYCGLHKQYFETRERRERDRMGLFRPRPYRPGRR